jgi:sterol desaturase/sphingolipid hydroxylase (fatty acid hydroxylase superfamily)
MDEKQNRPGFFSLTAIGLIVTLLGLYLASDFAQRVEPDQLTLLYPDGSRSAKKIPPYWVVEQVLEGPVQLEMTFPKCRRFDRYRFWVGTDGLDSTTRQPSAWTVWVNNGENAWALADRQTISEGYLNGLWYAYPLTSGNECIKRVRIDVNKISGSNVLRLYKFQLYESSYLERRVSAWVASSQILASSLYYISAAYAGFLGIPGVRTAFTTTIVVILAALTIQLLLIGWEKSALKRLMFNRNSSANKDVVCALLAGLGYLGIFTTIYSLGGDKLTAMLSKHVVDGLSRFSLQLDSGSVVLDIVIYLLVVTFFDYWSHRLLHTKLFWPLHRFHHSATEFNSLTVYRNHPATVAWDPLIKMWPLALLPMTPSISEYWPLVPRHRDYDSLATRG